MSLHEDWKQISNAKLSPDESKIFWDKYFLKEKEVYEEILENREFSINMTFKDFAQKYGFELPNAIGFFDGINTSLKIPVELEPITEETEINVEIDIEKLYYNMHECQADWLYNLTQWDDILDIQKRKEIEKAYKSSKTVIVSEKTRRNDPCPCGSGKKYKKCCIQ